MKKNAVILIAVLFSFSMFGCGKKQQPIEELEPLTMEALTTINPNAQVTVPEAKPLEPGLPEVKAPEAALAEAKVLEPLPPAGPYKPTNHEIQTALKNAGYYGGAVDGKAGKMTKAAIEEFQKANNLKVDGKVGPKTWGLLSRHLSKPASADKPIKKR